MYSEPRAPVTACHHDHHQGWQRMGVDSVPPAALDQRLFRQHSVSLIPVRQRQVVLTCLHGNAALVPDSDHWTLAPGPPNLPAYQESRKPAHKTCPRGKDSAKAESPTQSCNSLGGVFLAGPFLLALATLTPTRSGLGGPQDYYHLPLCLSPPLPGFRLTFSGLLPYILSESLAQTWTEPWKL